MGFGTHMHIADNSHRGSPEPDPSTYPCIVTPKRNGRDACSSNRLHADGSEGVTPMMMMKTSVCCASSRSRKTLDILMNDACRWSTRCIRASTPNKVLKTARQALKIIQPDSVASYPSSHWVILHTPASQVVTPKALPGISVQLRVSR